MGKARRLGSQRISYAIGSVAQALRQASSLAKVIAYPMVSRESSFSCIAALSQNGPWLMDTWLDLRYAQRRWDASIQSSPIPLIETALDVAEWPVVDADLASSLKSKANALLVLLCSEMISPPNELVRLDTDGEQSRVTYCKALVAISEASIQSYSIGRLAASKLVQELTLLSSQYTAIGEDTDVWVRLLILPSDICIRVLTGIRGVPNYFGRLYIYRLGKRLTNPRILRNMSTRSYANTCRGCISPMRNLPRPRMAPRGGSCPLRERTCSLC